MASLGPHMGYLLTARHIALIKYLFRYKFWHGYVFKYPVTKFNLIVVIGGRSQRVPYGFYKVSGVWWLAIGSTWVRRRLRMTRNAIEREVMVF